MEYGLLGEKLGHSYSKPIHEALGRYSYELCPVSREELHDILARRAFKGMNVTIPYKLDVIPFCDFLSPEAQSAGSVNTLKVENGRLLGYNTDIGGFISLARRLGAEPGGRKAVILGSGGASRAARIALQQMGAGQIVVVSRQGPVPYEALYRDHADAEILVNATPVGMYPANLASPVELDRLPNLRWALDMIYNPARTRLLLDAAERGIPCADGLWMLVAQAMEAAGIFLDEPVPPEKTEEIYRQVRSGMLNVVLIGMPGCGKSTLGMRLSQSLGKRFVDCDGEIAREQGMTSGEIIERQGEDAFRRIETETLSRLGKESGLVIATGGGAVTRPENRDLLRQNGVLLHIRRPLDQLATKDRPLSRNLEELARTRMPLYRAWADREIDNTDLKGALRAARNAFIQAVW